MKKNPTFRGFLFAVIAVIASYGLSQFMNKKKLEYIIDNPTSQKIKVKVDDNSYDIEPFSFKKIELNIGEHILNNEHKFRRGHILHGVINPTKSTYYMYKRYYGSVANRDSVFSNAPIINIKNIDYKFTDTVSSYFIQDFYYNLDEVFPSWTNSQKDSLNIDSRKKIFRKNDFINFYKTENP